jgi:hypothetical protein
MQVADVDEHCDDNISPKKAGFLASLVNSTHDSVDASERYAEHISQWKTMAILGDTSHYVQGLGPDLLKALGFSDMKPTFQPNYTYRFRVRCRLERTARESESTEEWGEWSKIANTTPDPHQEEIAPAFQPGSVAFGSRQDRVKTIPRSAMDYTSAESKALHFELQFRDARSAEVKVHHPERRASERRKTHSSQKRALLSAELQERAVVRDRPLWKHRDNQQGLTYEKHKPKYVSDLAAHKPNRKKNWAWGDGWHDGVNIAR